MSLFQEVTPSKDSKSPVRSKSFFNSNPPVPCDEICQEEFAGELVRLTIGNDPPTKTMDLFCTIPKCFRRIKTLCGASACPVHPEVKTFKHKLVVDGNTLTLSILYKLFLKLN